MPFDSIYLTDVLIPAPGEARAHAFIGVRDGRIAALGTRAEAEPLLRAGVPHRDFGPAAVLPGLWDAHVHLLSTGIQSRQVDLRGAADLAAVFDRVGRAPAGAGELTIAANLDENALAEKRLPTGAELDAVFGARPLAVRRIDLHSMVLNAAGWKLLRVDPAWPGVELGAAGRPTGVVRGRAHELTCDRLRGLPAPMEKTRAYREGAALAARRGAVAVGALEGSPTAADDDVPALLSCQESLPVATFIFPQTHDVGAVRRLGLPRIGGCLLVDGSFGSFTAALFEPYDLAAFVALAHGAGLQLAFHAIGDRAVTQVMNGYALAQGEAPRPDARHRIEHAELFGDRDLARMAELGVVWSAQPAFDAYWGGKDGMYERRLGARRLLTNRLGTARAAGVRIAGGSDSPITRLDPLGGIAAAMSHSTPEERLTFDDALALFTTEAAYAFFAEGEWGTLTPGKYAAFTVVGGDPRALPPDRIADLAIVATVVNDTVVYDGSSR
jgi:predicted amidohydrolase YtcJ